MLGKNSILGDWKHSTSEHLVAQLYKRREADASAHKILLEISEESEIMQTLVPYMTEGREFPPSPSPL